MTRNNFSTGKDKEMFDLAEQYEKAQKEHSPFYLDGEDWADLTNWYACRNQYKLAGEVAQKGLQQHPDHTGLLVEQAYLYLDTKQYHAAGDIIGCMKDLTLPEVIILKATFLLETAEPEKAEDLLKSLEQENDLSDIIDIAYLFLEHGLPEKAWHWLQKGKKHENSTAYLSVLGDYYLAVRENEKAEKVFNELIDRNPYSAPYWTALARTYMAMNKPDKAAEACDFAIVSDREFGEAYVTRGLAYLALGNVEKAMEDSELAHKYGAMEEDYYLMAKALQHIDDEEWEKAYGLLMQVLEIDPLTSVSLEEVFQQLAYCLHKMNRNEEALNYCVQAEQLNPDDIENYFLEGNIHLVLNNQDFCTKAWEKAIDLDASAKTWKRIAEICVKEKRPDLAISALEELEKMGSSTPRLYKLMAMAYLVLNEKDLFLKYNALSDKPMTIQQLENIRKLMIESGEREEAEKLKEIIKSMK